MVTVKYYAFNVWVIFDGEKESVPFFDLVACDIEAAKADIAETYVTLCSVCCNLWCEHKPPNRVGGHVQQIEGCKTSL